MSLPRNTPRKCCRYERDPAGWTAKGLSRRGNTPDHSLFLQEIRRRPGRMGRRHPCLQRGCRYRSSAAVIAGRHYSSDHRTSDCAISRSCVPVKLFGIFRSRQFDLVITLVPKAGLLASLAAMASRVPVRLHIFQGEVWSSKSDSCGSSSRPVIDHGSLQYGITGRQCERENISS